MGQATERKETTLNSHIPPAEKASYPVRPGNKVTPLIDGEPAFLRICEAVETAKHSVWVTIAFHDENFRMPGDHGTLFDVLDRAAARGLDVRALFWRINEQSGYPETAVFSGLPEHRDMLKARGSRFQARWDQAQKQYCQHQKSWTIDAGQSGEIAFVGGINLSIPSVVAPGHGGGTEGHIHDVYVEVEGPSASDVHHNFVQRWNEASERHHDHGIWPDAQSQSDLIFPTALSSHAGSSLVQIQRTVRAGHYTDETNAPDHQSFEIASGEHSIIEQYVSAIDSAQDTIYVEDQAIGSHHVVERLDVALARGVGVVYLVPADANRHMVDARRDPKNKPFFDALAALGRHENFLLAGIAAKGDDGVLRNIYVHAKIAMIDDHWATIGSCNIGNRSFFGDVELNASFWDPDVVRKLRNDLFEEHLGQDLSHMTERAALAHYRQVAKDNAVRRAKGEDMTCNAFALDPARYPS